MALTLSGLALFVFVPVACADLQQHAGASHSVTIESSATFKNIGVHGAGLVRREAAKDSASVLEEKGMSKVDEAEDEEEDESKQKARVVSWETCRDGACKCSSRRRVVIRYQRERASGALESDKKPANIMTNWHFRSRARPYTNTSKAEFNRGFTSNANNLQMCGGDGPNSFDCLAEPKACSFDSSDSNPYDAKAGQYCCNAVFEYCSYKCQADETFKCPGLSTDQNFPGGMDPAGPGAYKKCYMAQYSHGMNPESATDADADVPGVADVAAPASANASSH